MSILQKQKMRDANLGYAKDLVDVCDEIMPFIVERGIKVHVAQRSTLLDIGKPAGERFYGYSGMRVRQEDGRFIVEKETPCAP
jgi:hypothetical protein